MQQLELRGQISSLTQVDPTPTSKTTYSPDGVMTPDCCDDSAKADFSELFARRRNSSNCHSGHSKQSVSVLEINRHLLLNFVSCCNACKRKYAGNLY